jgi:beta-glucosidase-like glycosyl hydrolase
MEMGAVLEFAPIEETVVQHIRAGGDLVLVCHQEELIVRAYETLIHEAEKDRKFRGRALESGRRVLAFKKKWINKLAAGRRIGAPTAARIDKLTRQVWEFGEEMRLGTLAGADNTKAGRA